MESEKTENLDITKHAEICMKHMEKLIMEKREEELQYFLSDHGFSEIVSGGLKESKEIFIDKMISSGRYSYGLNVEDRFFLKDVMPVG